MKKTDKKKIKKVGEKDMKKIKGGVLQAGSANILTGEENDRFFAARKSTGGKAPRR